MEEKTGKIGKVKKAPVPPVQGGGSDYCVYIGPTIPGVIAESEVFICGKLQKLATITTVVAEYPEVQWLMVSSANLAQSRQALADKETFLSQRYASLARRLEGGS